MPSQGFHELLDYLVKRGRSSDGDPDMEQLRAKVVAMFERFYDPPEHSFDEVDAGGVPAAWIRSSASEPQRLVLYFHGGGYNTSSVHTHRDICARISHTAGADVLSVGYRLAPEHKFPAPIDDGLTVYRWLVEEQGRAPSEIAFSGDSAGAGLALGVALACRDLGEPMPGCIAVMSPLGDLAYQGASVSERAHRDPLVTPHGSRGNAARYLRSWHDRRNPLASPVYGDYSGMPPTLLMVGTEELLHDDATRIADRMKSNGRAVEVYEGEGMIHAWPLFASQVPEGQRALEHLGAFVRANLD